MAQIPTSGLHFRVYFSGNPERGNFREDGNGFFRQGEITIYPDRLELTGRTHWPLVYRILTLVAVELCALFFGFLIGGLGILLLERYLMMQRHTATIPRLTVRGLDHRKRAVKFSGVAEGRSKEALTCFLARDEAEAGQIMAALFEPIEDANLNARQPVPADNGWG